MSSALLAAALSYAAQGWPVFPCEEAGKLPLTSHGLKDATTDPKSIRQWWNRWPNANIGIPTGPASGFVVIDIDGEAGEAALKKLAEKRHIPDTLQSNTGNGHHILFSCPDPPIRNTQGDKGMGLGVGIDTRGEGGFIIAPPSIHSTGSLYEWIEPRNPLADLPDWLNPLKVHDREKAKRRNPIAPILNTSDITVRASAYLASMPAAIQGHGGHSSLYAAATALVHGFKLSEDEAFDMLSAEFNPRCIPPWDLDSAKDRREFRRKVNQAAIREHDQPKGWLLNEPSGRDGDVDRGCEIASAILSGQSVPAIVPVKKRKASPIPQGLLNPGGIAGEICAWINDTSRMPQPVFALANSIAFVGALVGRKVQTPSELRTNMYCLSVGDSGSGKDHSRRCIKNLCEHAGVLDELLGGEEIASDAGLIAAVKRQPSTLFQLDEIGHMLTSFNSKSAQSYQRQIPSTLTKLFTSASSVCMGREYADGERDNIIQPNACVYGTTVPGRLYEGITSRDITDGFLGRMLVFETTDHDPDRRYDAARTDPPQALIDKVVAWSQWTPPIPDGVGNIESLRKPHPIVADIDESAAKAFINFDEETRRIKRKLTDGKGLNALWSRAAEHAEKIALIVSCDEPGRPVIGIDVARYAIDLVRRLVDSLVSSVQDHVSDTSYGQDQLRIYRVIRDAGEVTTTNLSRRTQGMDPQIRKRAIEELLLIGRITITTKNADGRGRPATVYQIAMDDAA